MLVFYLYNNIFNNRGTILYRPQLSMIIHIKTNLSYTTQRIVINLGLTSSFPSIYSLLTYLL